MKKIYLSITALAFAGCLVGQTIPALNRRVTNHEVSTPRPIKTKSINPQAKVAGGPGRFRAFLGDEIITLKNYTEDTEYKVYGNVVYMDSTVNTSNSTGVENVFNMKAGVVIDPISIFWGQGNPLLTRSDAYTIDSLFIGGRYSRVNHSVVDTLLVECTWAAPNNGNVWEFLSLNTATPAISLLSVQTNSSSSHGNTSFFNVPSTNYKQFKYPLTDADTSRRLTNYYKIVPSGSLSIPAGNVFAFAYTFVPGQAVAPGSVVHAYPNATAPQTSNSFVGYLLSDPNSTVTPAHNYFWDNSSASTALDYFHWQRYGLMKGNSAFLNTTMLPNLDGVFDIGVAISYPSSSVGLNELDNKGFALGQNTPNPYSGESTVNYALAKDATSAVFTVTDIMGRLVYSEKVNATQGTHSVKLGSYTPGIYYYSLNVDGKVSTNKMVVE